MKAEGRRNSGAGIFVGVGGGVKWGVFGWVIVEKDVCGAGENRKVYGGRGLWILRGD